LETAINGVHTVHSMDMDLVYNHRYLHRDMMDTWQGAVDWVYDHDDSFYRLEKTYTRTANDNMTLGVRGLTHSSSAPNRKALTLLRDFGFKGSSSVSHYMDAVPTTDALFHFKYILTRDSALYGDYVKIGETAEGVSIYENQKALSIGYMADSAIYDFGEQDLSGLAPFRCQNNFIKDLTGTDRNVFEKIEVLSTTLDNCKLDASGSQNFYHKVDKAEPATITYTLSAKDGQKLYLYFGCYNQHDVTLSVDGRDLGYYFDGDSFVVAAGPMAGDTCEVVLTLKEDKTAMYEHQVYFYTLNEEAWAAAYDLLADELYQVTDWDSRSLKGTIDVKNDGVFMTSIPYETGWNIRVDGEPVEGKCVGTAFLAFDLNAGEHTVELSFMPRIVVLGACGSAVGIGLYLIILVLEIRKIRKEQWVRIMAWSAFCQERAQELRNRQEFRLQKMAEAHDIRRMERIKRLMEEQIKQELE